MIKFEGETIEIESWIECLQKVSKKILDETGQKEKILEVKGTKRDYFVRNENQSDLVYPKNIPKTEFYFEGKLSANDVIRITEKVMKKFDYDVSELEIFTEESQED